MAGDHFGSFFNYSQRPFLSTAIHKKAQCVHVMQRIKAVNTYLYKNNLVTKKIANKYNIMGGNSIFWFTFVKSLRDSKKRDNFVEDSLDVE